MCDGFLGDPSVSPKPLSTGFKSLEDIRQSMLQNVSRLHFMAFYHMLYLSEIDLRANFLSKTRRKISLCWRSTRVGIEDRGSTEEAGSS